MCTSVKANVHHHHVDSQLYSLIVVTKRGGSFLMRVASEYFYARQKLLKFASMGLRSFFTDKRSMKTKITT